MSLQFLFVVVTEIAVFLAIIVSRSDAAAFFGFVAICVLQIFHHRLQPPADSPTGKILDKIGLVLYCAVTGAFIGMIGWLACVLLTHEWHSPGWTIGLTAAGFMVWGMLFPKAAWRV